MTKLSSISLPSLSAFDVASSLGGNVLILSFCQSSIPLPPEYKEERKELTLSFPKVTLFRGEFTKKEEEEELSQKINYFLNFAKEKKYEGVLFGSWKYVPFHPLGRIYREVLENEKELKVHFFIPEAEANVFQQILN